jgi:hypothetical protein
MAQVATYALEALAWLAVVLFGFAGLVGLLDLMTTKEEE